MEDLCDRISTLTILPITQLRKRSYLSVFLPTMLIRDLAPLLHAESSGPKRRLLHHDILCLSYLLRSR